MESQRCFNEIQVDVSVMHIKKNGEVAKVNINLGLAYGDYDSLC